MMDAEARKRVTDGAVWYTNETDDKIFFTKEWVEKRKADVPASFNDLKWEKNVNKIHYYEDGNQCTEVVSYVHKRVSPTQTVFEFETPAGTKFTV